MRSLFAWVAIGAAVALVVGAAVLRLMGPAVPACAALPASGSTTRVSTTAGGAEADRGGLAPAISDDGSRVAFVSQSVNLAPDGSRVRRIYFRSGAELTLVTDYGSGAGPVISAEGDWLTYADNGSISSWEATTGTWPGEPFEGDEPDVSADGRFIAFASLSDGYVAGDTNEEYDAFVRDRSRGTTERVSVGAGGQADGASSSPSISGDGTVVTFLSYATNLVAGDTNRQVDVFVRDLVAGTTVLASVPPSGVLSFTPSATVGPVLSRDGRWVAFLASDARGAAIYLRDLARSATELAVRVAQAPLIKPGARRPPFDLSADGCILAFVAWERLLPADTNDHADLYLRDRSSGTLVLATVTPEGGLGNAATSGPPWLSGDGRFVAFSSAAGDLVAGDTNNAVDAFVREIGPP